MFFYLFISYSYFLAICYLYSSYFGFLVGDSPNEAEFVVGGTAQENGVAGLVLNGLAGCS